MASWLRNIQGQITDVVSEVLNEASDVLAEAREEVADPDTELIVVRKKCAEAEKQLAIEASRVESLEGEKKGLEQQLYDAHVEMDTIGQKLNGMVRQRDEEIKKLKNQLEQIHESGWNDAGDEGTEHAEQISELKSQVAHWKELHENSASSEGSVSKTELERRLEEAQQRKEHEIQALIESHAESMVELREMYEEKMAALAVIPYNASSSTSNADALDAVLLERDELSNKAKSSTNGSDLGDRDRPVVVDLGSHDELVDERIRQMEAELERCKEEKEVTIESLRSQNEELAKAYDELNTEFEQFKMRNAQTENRNDDLNRRIQSLKANVIEYEERYELCKKENMTTVAQLEKLSGDFEKLRAGVASVSQRREDADSLVNEEVEKLRNALEESRAERERLREDVARFTVSVGEIDVELEKLRGMNRQLLAENEALTQNLTTYERTMQEVITSSENDIGNFRDQFREIQHNHARQREAVHAENAALRDELDAIKKQRDIVMEESRLVKEVNEKLKQKAAAEENKIRLLTQKVDLLQETVDEVKKRNVEQEEEQKDPELALTNLNVLRKQLSEALKANCEKSEECDRIRVEARELEREVELRQNCVDEMIAQTNTLQMQQETMSTANRTLQTQLLEQERRIVKLEEELNMAEEQSQQLKVQIQRLENVFVPAEDTEEREQPGPEAMSRYITDLQERLSSSEEELKAFREQQIDANKAAEEVRNELERSLFEAEEVDRGLLEGIEERVKELETELMSKAEQLEAAEAEKRRIGESLVQLTERIRNLEAESSKTDVLREQVEMYKQKLEGIEKEKEMYEKLTEENTYLKTVAQTHHDENVKYYEKCQEMAAENEKMQAQMQQMSRRVQEFEGKLAVETDAQEKRAKELQRLREHLMIVEENSTREAVESEQRETELRARVRELEARGHAAEEGATESTQQYQEQIGTLATKLESAERAATEWRGKYEHEVRAREQTAEALASLQNVVRELSVDHERDAAAANHRNLELQTQISTLNDEIARFSEAFDRQTLARQAAEEENERRQLQLVSKQKIVEDLEQQIEELRSPQKTDSYRIDDSTLRQLFLNYFSAEPSKRPDIAMLLASILEYPQDEMDKFRSAVRQSFSNTGGGSSFFFGSRGSTPTGGASLSEQFIRFLEVESESSRTAPQLPIRGGQTERQAPQMSLDSPRQKSASPQPSQASASSSAAALDSLLR
ncbi:unnamed protein product [Caenorhabditis sp. 36 PRJEB53466]|nr:unnamed protein product [Caenorhabditis sp. 36 PRJEB53466]